MPSLLVKNVPPVVHEALKQRAKRHLRSVNNEAIACLSQVLIPDVMDVEAELAKVRELRKLVKGHLNDADLAKMIDRGRR